MSKKAFDKIMEGLNEALAVARGEATPAKLHVPAEIDVRKIRIISARRPTRNEARQCREGLEP
jgi:hypothetical protein